jgi:hypothetical protein
VIAGDWKAHVPATLSPGADDIKGIASCSQKAGDLGLDFGITAQRAEQPDVGGPSRIKSCCSSGAFGALIPSALLIIATSWVRMSPRNKCVLTSI